MAQRLPDNVRELSGTRPRPAREYVRFGPTRDLPMPDFAALLGDADAAAEAEREWQRAIVPLAERGLIAAVDSALAADYCVCCARVRQAEAALAIDGLMVEAAGRPDRGLVRHPLLVALNQYRAHVGKLARALGIGPAARQAINAPPMTPDTLPDAELSRLRARATELGIVVDFSDADFDLTLTDDEAAALGL